MKLLLCLLENKNEFNIKIKNVAVKSQGLLHSIAHGGLVRIDGGVTPTSGFSLSTQQICEVIKE
ncbi:hypothetical protein SO802_014251 [Lithocarpus litseifolius]|uniref:Uncharacterized protein n=1 Tax=Lithocarpus litseifolius TaxID=425828 RepID=A0AAW2CTF9_9ROSI